MRDDSQASGAEEGHVVRGEDGGRRGSGGGRRLWCAVVRRDGTFVSSKKFKHKHLLPN